MGRWIPVSNIKGIHLTYLILCLSESPILKSSIGGVCELSQDRWWGVSQMCVCLCESVGIVWGIVLGFTGESGVFELHR